MNEDIYKMLENLMARMSESDDDCWKSCYAQGYISAILEANYIKGESEVSDYDYEVEEPEEVNGIYIV